eukprot:TRINITY_DN2194_c0_g1_i1.p1 TRINITY_DN2194_c0_g1~~TRINITY_DN2194_c0_g1_i1.p1  ORF type:complete len:393 (+),score=146.95 TRINITY_DN2194_c0_g1_i1:113-1180(+)
MYGTACGLAVNHIMRCLQTIKTNLVKIKTISSYDSYRQVMSKLESILRLKIKPLQKVSEEDCEEEYEEVVEEDEEKEKQIKKFKKSGSISDVYEIGQQLGSGYYAVVNSCKHKQKGYQRAVKIVSVSESEVYANHLKLAKNELSIWVGVEHPNLASLVEVFNSDEKYYFVMDLYSGAEMTDKLIEISKFREPDARKYIDQLLQAVNCLHQAYICHRDIKLENMMLSSRDGEVRLILHGLSQAEPIWTDEDGNETPMTNALPGSIIYHAPESFNKSYLKSIDVWAVGVVAYIMMCGVPPFAGDTDEEIKSQINVGKPIYNPDFPDQARAFITKVLTFDPSSRPTAANAVQHNWLRG